MIFTFQAGIPYNPSNQCQQTNRCNTNDTNIQLLTSNNVQGVNVLPIPITVPVPIVPTELFSHLQDAVNPSPGSTHGNVDTIIQTQQQQQHSQLQHQQQQQQPQQGPPQQEGSNSDLVPFQICPQQAEIMYSNMEATSNQQQRSSQH